MIVFSPIIERLYLCGMDAQILHIDFTVPQGWHELNDKQLRFVYHLIATDNTTDEIKVSIPCRPYCIKQINQSQSIKTLVYLPSL